MGLTRRGFMKGAAAGGAMFALRRLARAQSAGSAYSVAVLGDTHFDQALQPEFVASYGDLTEDVSAADMARYTAQSTYHANWVEEVFPQRSGGTLPAQRLGRRGDDGVLSWRSYDARPHLHDVDEGVRQWKRMG